MTIPFNIPCTIGTELNYITEAIQKNRKLSGNGVFTKRCQDFFENKYGFKKSLLTTSCTDALEMAAILANIKVGDEVIIPSYTFVSTALAFVRQGATIVFADSYAHNPNIDANLIESLITPRTKAIVPVHYAGVACDMEKIMNLAKQYNLWVIEDAAQAIDSYYTFSDGSRKPLGGIGHLAAFSFHETKNIISGEGGMLAINDEQFVERAEIIWEKGTNRSQFFRGEVNKYGWVDTGSSFLPSELVAAYLWAQLENIDRIQQKRIAIWNLYFEKLQPLADNLGFKMPDLPDFASNNAHMFYIVFDSLEKRNLFIAHLKASDIHPVFHYLSLHSSDFYTESHDGRALPHSDKFTDCLVRLPLYYDLELLDVTRIVDCIATVKL